MRPKVQPSDVVQDALLEASRLFDRFGGDEADQFRLWLRSILLFKVNEAHGRFLGTAKRSPEREVSMDESRAGGNRMRDALPAEGPTPSRVARRAEDATAVARALERLSETDRQVVMWRNWDGLAFADIGTRLGRSENAVRMLFVRALERLHAALEQTDDRPTAAPAD